MCSRHRNARGEWSDQEIIELFEQRCRELADTKLMQTDLNITYTISYDRDTGWHEEASPVDETELRAMLTVFRPFVMETDPVYLDKVYQICELRITDNILRLNARESRRYWKEALKASGIQLSLDEKAVRPAEFLDLWINAHYFHRDDREKILRLQGLNAAFPGISHHQFIDVVIEILRRVQDLAEIVGVARSNGYFSFENGTVV